MTIFIMVTGLMILCFAASFVFKALEILFTALNGLIKIIDWFISLCNRFIVLEYNIAKESICYARRLGLYFGFLESQKIKLLMKLRSTSRFS